ncbi:MAG: response regulator transcription factor [Bacillota bacterium]
MDPQSLSRTLPATFKALIATDDDALTSVESSALKQLNFDTVTAHDNGEMLNTVKEEKPDLVILDAALPGGGIDACRKLREDPNTAEIPIIMVTSADNNTEKVEALETGADDCVTRPVQVDVLVAHIKAVTRRALPDLPSNRLRAGPIEMDLDRWTVSIGGQPLELTKKEFRLLQVLLEAKGRALTRDFLLQKAWSHATIHGLDTRTVDVHIGRLRRKLGSAGQYIITVRNVGFRFDILPDWITSYHSP